MVPDRKGHGEPPVVLWVVPVADLAGVARHVTDVAMSGIPDWRLAVLVPPGPLAEELTQLGIDVHVERFGPDHGLSASVASLRRTITSIRPEIVHSHLAYADIVVALASPLGIPLVSTEHGIALDDHLYHSSRLGGLAMRWVHRIRIRRFARVIAVSLATSSAVVAKWRPSPGRRPRVMRNGCDRQASHLPLDRESRSRVHVASISRLAPEKQIGRTIDAFVAFTDVRPAARLSVAGEGALLDRLTAQVDAAGLSQSVEFVGHVDARRLLADVDVLVQLSTWENCSYSLLDAVSAGCGVVASNVGGNPELLPGHCLVEPSAPPRSIAERILEQAEHPARRPSLPEGWPSVAEMCGAIAEIYSGVRR